MSAVDIKVNALVSCDDQSFYHLFLPHVKDVWEKRFGISAQLVLITQDACSPDFDQGVLKINPLPGYPLYLQAQLARIYYSKFFPEDINVLSDIDMFPVCVDFFKADWIREHCSPSSFLHLNPERREFNQFPLCYYCGYGSLYESLLEGLSWEGFLASIYSLNINTDNFNYQLPPHLSGKNLWFSDEMFLFSQVQKLNIDINGRHPLIGNKRIDREQILNLDYSNLQNGNIVDIHLPRPYHTYHKEIALLSAALSSSSHD